jgi:hypothetical protein
MYKVLKADKDTYITDRVVESVRCMSANVGAAGSLDLFKLYAFSMSGSAPNIELSRLLVHFDLSSLRSLVAAGRIDPSNPSFECRLKLFDVYGGQPTPTNFAVTVNPLSRSFEEGLGHDVVQYTDEDLCNFLSGSYAQGAWLASGCGLGGGLPGTVDYATASAGALLTARQTFVTGEEDLDVDITAAISATLGGTVPDEGFRIAYTEQIENDTRSYFVKRFASRTAYNDAKHPRLIVKFDDSVQDDTQLLVFDASCTMFMYNYVLGAPANVTAGSQLTGSNCVVLKLATAISGGWHELQYSGSQHRVGSSWVTGVYSASVVLPSSDPVLVAKLQQSGSVDFIPVWSSPDGTVAFTTGSIVTARRTYAYASNQLPKKYAVSVYGIDGSVRTTDELFVRVHVFDHDSPLVKLTKFFKNMPGVVVRDAHYSVRDVASNAAAVPFDTTKNSTRLSSDADGMWFKLDASSLTSGRSYVIDIKFATLGGEILFPNASSIFTVKDVQ